MMIVTWQLYTPSLEFCKQICYVDKKIWTVMDILGLCRGAYKEYLWTGLGVGQ